jgi:hypothetical protein
VAYLLMDEKEEKNTVPSESEQEVTTTNPESVAQIEGTWVSNYDGAMLTIKGFSFSVELSGLDAGPKMMGNLAVEGNIVTFVYDSGNKACQSIEGHYLYALENNGDLFFKLIKDNCESRKERMTATWFKL